MKSKIVAFAVAVLASIGLSVGVATPAQAWSYCNKTYPSIAVYLTDLQGYCGDRQTWVVYDMSPGTCIYLGNWSNWAAAVVNNSSRHIILSDTINCTGSASVGITSGTSHPNLYNIAGQNLGNKISSIYITG